MIEPVGHAAIEQEGPQLPPGWDQAMAQAGSTPPATAQPCGLWTGFNAKPVAVPVRDCLLAGTVTPGQVRQALLRNHTPAAAEAALAGMVHTRAAGGQVLRNAIRQQAALCARWRLPGNAGAARALIKLARQAEPGWGAGPAVRSLLRARLSGQLPMTRGGAKALATFFHANGYVTPGQGRLPNGLPFNVTEADQDAARLLARAGGAWHPDAAYPRPSQAKVRIAIIDTGFSVIHPLLSPKIGDLNNTVALSEDSPTLHTAANAAAHGTAVATAAGGNTHVIDLRLFRYDVTKPSCVNDLASLTPLAAKGGPIVNISMFDAGHTVEQRASIAGRRADMMSRWPGTLFVQAAGNRNTKFLPEQEEVNLSLSGPDNILTVSGLNANGAVDPFQFVYDPLRVDTLARGHAYLPLDAADGSMEPALGSSLSAPLASNQAAMMSALAPHLPAVLMKKLILGTTTPIPVTSWTKGGPEPSAHPPISRARASRVAALEGLVVSGTPDPVRTITIAIPGGARQERRGGESRRPGERTGMTVEQAADALKLRGAERVQALADYARLLTRDRP